MVILGRQDPSLGGSGVAGNAWITDVSGGLVSEQGPSPTPCIKTTEWVNEGNGIWTLFQDNGSGNVVTKFTGRQKDLFTGSRKVSITGSEPGAFDYSITADDPQAAGAQAIRKGIESRFRGTDADNDPVIVSETWASTMTTYNGTDGKPIPSIYSLTHAYFINNLTFAVTTLNVTTAIFNVNVLLGLFDLELYPAIKRDWLMVEIKSAEGSNLASATAQKATIAKLQLLVTAKKAAANLRRLTTMLGNIAGSRSRANLELNEMGAEQVEMNVVSQDAAGLNFQE
jgi:hypothetical protein